VDQVAYGPDAGTDRIAATTLTDHAVDGGSQVGRLLEQLNGPATALIGDDAYDQTGVYEAAAKTMPRQRDHRRPGHC